MSHPLPLYLAVRFFARNAVIAALFFVLTIAPARAWFFEGHAQIADIAWTKLTPRARTAISEILRLGPEAYRPKSEAEIDVRAAFAKAAGFADDIKNDRQVPIEYVVLLPKMNQLFWENGVPPADDREANRCKTWHYFDVPLRVPTGLTIPPRRASSILMAYPYAVSELTRLSKTPERDRALQFWWLAWIEHLTGDAHQPLHCSESFALEKEGDAGGNLFLLGFKDDRDRQVRLHAYWDGAINDGIAREKKEEGKPDDMPAVTARWTAQRPESAFGAQIQQLSILRWVREGATLANEDVYIGVKLGDSRKTLQDSGYEAARESLSRRQAVLAGYRLAAALNEVFAVPGVR